MALYAFAHKSFEDVAVRGRQAIAGMFAAGDLDSIDPLAVRSGILGREFQPHRIVGTMDVVIPAFKAIIQGSELSQGAYAVVNTADTTVTIPDNPSGSTILYYLYAVVRDDAYDGSGETNVILELVPFLDPPSSPTALRLCSIAALAGQTSGSGGLTTDPGVQNDVRTVVEGGIYPYGSTGPTPSNSPFVPGGLLRSVQSGKLWVGDETINKWVPLYDPEHRTDGWVNGLPSITVDPDWTVTSFQYKVNAEDGLAMIDMTCSRNTNAVFASGSGSFGADSIVTNIPQLARPRGEVPWSDRVTGEFIQGTISGSTIYLNGGFPSRTLAAGFQVNVSAYFMADN